MVNNNSAMQQLNDRKSQINNEVSSENLKDSKQHWFT